MDRGVRSGRLACLTAVAAAIFLSALPQAAGASSLGFSTTPSRTEPYAACGQATPGHSVCKAVLVPAAGTLSSNGTSSPTVSPSFSGGGVGGGYDPADLRSAYNLPESPGVGQTVAIVDAFDDPNAESDLATYRSHYGLSACTTANGCFKKVNETGGNAYPSPNPGWSVEISLDLDMVSAACPNCHILLVEASSNNDSNLYASVDEAVALGATEVSNSWAGKEYSTETSFDKYFRHPGVPVTASAGDEGYRVEYPAASQYVISVGGTKLTKATNARGWTEEAWNKTGSGCSEYEPKPVWQTDSGCVRRTDNDVAAVASTQTPVSVADSYELPSEFSKPEPGWTLVGGTSVSSPLVAGMIALANQYTRTFTGAYAFYLQAAQNGTGALDDVVSGSNGTCGNYLCKAGVGYDGPTGLGSPYGAPVVMPEWYRNGARSKAGAKTPTISWGALTLKTTKGGSGEVTCHTVEAGTDWNPEGGSPGRGETLLFATYGCEQTGVCPEGATVAVAGQALPWSSTLEASASLIRARTEKVKIDVSCSSGGHEVSAAKFVGSYAPSAGGGTSALHPGLLEFDPGSGALEEEGSGGAVQDRVEGFLTFFGFSEEGLVIAK